MRATLAVLAIGIAAVTGGCRQQQEPESVWFAGSFEEALAAAEARDTLLFLDFRNDGCIPCRRMEEETFPHPEVAARLRELVALKLDPDKSAADQELHDRYEVRYYPAMIFADAEGRELERLGEFFAPEEFIGEIERILNGDTFAARSEMLDENPGDPDLLRSVVSTLHAHLDLDGAYARIDAFRSSGHGLSPDPSIPLLYRVHRTQFNLWYGDARRWYRAGWEEIPDVPELRGAPALEAFLKSSPGALDRDEQARRLRRARHEDAAPLIAMRMEQDLSTDELYLTAEFAYKNGHYDTAADLFRRWYRRAGDDATPRRLNEAAASLYLCRRALDTAVEMARAGRAAGEAPGTAATMALILYATGGIDEAVGIVERVAAASEGQEREAYARILERMKAGEEPYPEGRPGFDLYPEG